MILIKIMLLKKQMAFLFRFVFRTKFSQVRLHNISFLYNMMSH